MSGSGSGYGATETVESERFALSYQGTLKEDEVIAPTMNLQGGSPRTVWMKPVAATVLLLLLTLLLTSGWSVPWKPSDITAFTARVKQDNIFENDSSSVEDMNTPKFYRDQIVDHFADVEVSSGKLKTFTNRYYESKKYFGGPGHPVILIVGGEDAIDHGMLYPFVANDLAQALGAAVVQIEHRFYGTSQPVDPSQRTIQDLERLLTPEQAMMDMIQLTNHVRFHEYGCSPDRSSPEYCPVITVGGSYPGFLSFLFRMLHPEFCDIAYASAAPIFMYSQVSSQYAYYDAVTAAADRLVPGCSSAVRQTLDAMEQTIETQSTSLADVAQQIGICPNSIPADIKTKEGLRASLNDIIRISFADYTMDAYPPRANNPLHRACEIFTNENLNSRQTLRSFFLFMKEREKEEAMGCDYVAVHCEPTKLSLPPPLDFCFDMSPSGGVVEDDEFEESANKDGSMWDMWDFQSCTNMAVLIGASDASMFPPLDDTYRLEEDMCHDEFGPDIAFRPYELVEKYDYVNRLYHSNETSYILFTNGLQDLWAPGGILHNISRTVVTLTFENGAHHSELSHQGPNDQDTDDIKQGYKKIKSILKSWLQEQEERKSSS